MRIGVPTVGDEARLVIDCSGGRHRCPKPGAYSRVQDGTSAGAGAAAGVVAEGTGGQVANDGEVEEDLTRRLSAAQKEWHGSTGCVRSASLSICNQIQYTRFNTDGI